MRTKRSKTVLYPVGWYPVPEHLNELVTVLTAPELRLYLVLLSESKGRTWNVDIENTDLMTRAGLNKDNLPPARGGLIERGVIKARPVDGHRTLYRYQIEDALDPDATGADEYGANVEVIPESVLFRQPGRG